MLKVGLIGCGGHVASFRLTFRELELAGGAKKVCAFIDNG